MRELKVFVFVSSGRRFVGWADAERVRWALAKRYHWLEPAYASAYSSVVGLPGMAVPDVRVVSSEGRLVTDSRRADEQMWPNAWIIQQFLNHIQSPAIPPDDQHEWTDLPSTGAERAERAAWLDAILLTNILGPDLVTESRYRGNIDDRPGAVQLRTVLSSTARYLAIVQKSGQFEYLLSRDDAVDRFAREMADRQT